VSEQYTPTIRELTVHLSRLNDSKAIGRSENYKRLINFLVGRVVSGMAKEAKNAIPPKEIEIAIEVFNKKQHYNPSNDSTVRVYISNMRKKLSQYYQEEGKNEKFRITIPPGSYALEFYSQIESVSDSEHLLPAKVSNRKATIEGNTLFGLIILIVALLVSFSLNIIQFKKLESLQTINRSKIQNHAVWRDLYENNKPLLLVVGDLFVYREKNTDHSNDRLIRNFYINSKEDLVHYVQEFPDKSHLIHKAGRKILPKSSFEMFKALLPLFNDNQDFQFKLASQLNAEDIKQYNIIYIGFSRSMGMLRTYHRKSHFETRGKEIIHSSAGLHYKLNGYLLQEYTDFGLFTKINSVDNNVIYFITGITDAAVMHMSKKLTNAAYLKRIDNMKFKEFDILYEVKSFNHTDLSGKTIFQQDIKPL
jgi:hypothetical protein